VNPRLFLQVMSLEARTQFSYRVDFWINAVLSFGVEIMVAWYLWSAIFEASGETEIGGRTFPAMILYYVTVLLLGRFARGRDFEGTVQGDIYEGGLNRYLVLPVAYRPYKYAQGLGKTVPVVVQVVLFGAIAIPVLGVASEADITLPAVLMTICAVAMANVLNFLLVFPLQTVAFWADNVWSLMVAQRIMGQILGGYMLPLSVYPGWGQRVLEFLPWRFLFDFPARVLLGEIGFVEWGLGMLIALGWCGLFWLAGQLIWRRGLYQYSGVGI
jgi:ABC-2 type transport system permease protein